MAAQRRSLSGAGLGHIVRRTQDRLAKRDLDKTLTSRLGFDKRLEDAIREMREAALEDRRQLQQDFDDKVQQMKDAADSHTTHKVEKAVKEIERVALRTQQTANTEHGRRMEEAAESHREQMKEAPEGYRLHVKQQARSKLEEDAPQREHGVAVEGRRSNGFIEMMAWFDHKYPEGQRPSMGRESKVPE